MFSICIPSRGRPQMLYDAVASIVQTANNPKNIHIYVFIDNDDPKHIDYVDLKAKFPPTVHMYTEQEQILTPGKAWDWLAQQAMKDGTDYLMLGSDDVHFKTNDWDIIMQPYLTKYPDNIFCMWFNDLVEYADKEYVFAQHPIIHRKWVETIGYFIHRDFNILHADTWIFNLARRLNRLIYRGNYCRAL